METSFLKFSAIFLLPFLMLTGCETEKPTKDFNAYVIGIHPCTRSYTSDSEKGYILKLTDKQDTVFNFNLPQKVAKKIKEDHPETIDGTFFSDKYRESYPLTIEFIYLREGKRTFPVCIANILTAPISNIKKEVQIIE